MSRKTLLKLEWTGSAAAVAGAFLVAVGDGHGFCFFLASNVCFGGLALGLRRWGLLATQGLFAVCSVIGIVRLAAGVQG